VRFAYFMCWSHFNCDSALTNLIFFYHFVVCNKRQKDISKGGSSPKKKVIWFFVCDHQAEQAN